nr:hypothetical protein [uncultured Cohaesibacter sp.]
MHSQRLSVFVKFSTMTPLVMFLAACAGGGAPTPPGAIGRTPPSILDSLPPAEDTDTLPDTGDMNEPVIGQNADLPPASSFPAAGAVQTTQPAQTTQYQAPVSKAVLTFEPMVGAPASVARELSQALGMRVAQQALPVVTRNDKKVTHRIKGYFSASQSGSDCVISYVWDIFDAKGKRINRINGTQKTKMVSSDPWDSVTGPVLDQVAADTAAKLKTWHASI